MCNHKLSTIQSLAASGPFKQKCTECGQFVFREHPRASLPFKILFIDRIGILFFVLLFLVFPHLPLALSILSAVTVVLYAWDIKAEPLREFTEDEQFKENKKNKIILVASLFILSLAVWVAVNET